MRVMVDALIVKPGQAGLRSVAINLARALAEHGDVKLLVVAPLDTKSDWGDQVSVVTPDLRRNSPIARWRWRRRHRDRLASARGIDLIITVSPEYARSRSAANVIIVHDIGPLIAPGLYGLVRYVRYLMTIRYAVRNADAVICVSASTKLDLVRWCGLETASKLRVINNAGQLLPEASPLPKSVSDGPYVLYVGSFLPHKNVETILNAYAADWRHLPGPLVCVGPDYAGEKRDALSPHRNEPWVIDLGFVAPEELRALYENAAVVVFPSLFEGYGMPVVEAVTMGSRVLSTRLSVIEDLVGQSVEYVSDPLSTNEWSTALRGYGRLVDAAVPQVDTSALDLFSWERVAREVVALGVDVIHARARSTTFPGL